MKNMQEIIKSVYQFFSSFEKPNQYFYEDSYIYTDLEREDFANDFKNIGLSEFTIKHVGIAGWSAVPLFNEKALGYFMPKLIDLALNLECDEDGELFLPRLLYCLCPTHIDHRFSRYNSEHKKCIIEVLHYINNELSGVISDELCEDELKEALDFWKKL